MLFSNDKKRNFNSLNEKLKLFSNELKLVDIVDFPSLRAVLKVLKGLTPELVEKLLKLGLPVREVRRNLNWNLKSELFIFVEFLK